MFYAINFIQKLVPKIYFSNMEFLLLIIFLWRQMNYIYKRHILKHSKFKKYSFFFVLDMFQFSVLKFRRFSVSVLLILLYLGDLNFFFLN